MTPSLTKSFSEVTINDTATVGGKSASLGEMFSQLSSRGIRIPGGFTTTSAAFWLFIKSNGFADKLDNILAKLDRKNYDNLAQIGAEARKLMLSGKMPNELSADILKQYNLLRAGEADFKVAVRSSATAEDLPGASFAGQHESYLNIDSEENLLKSVQMCMASLYTDRAIKYREDMGFEHSKVALSVAIQKMVRADLGCSGIGFTLDPESGFRNVVHLSGVWGLGENIVQGLVTPDEFYVFKPSLEKNKMAIIKRKLGTKETTMIYAAQNANHPIRTVNTPTDLRARFVLSSAEIHKLARWACVIEQHYNKPMDIEWAKDGLNGELFILQARPETVHSNANPQIFKEFRITKHGKQLASGQAVGSKVVIGTARLLGNISESGRLMKGDIVVTDGTTPDWDPILKKAAGIITNKGGRTSHASIVARELGVPAVVGTGNGTSTIKDGSRITVSCAEGNIGHVYEGEAEFEEFELDTGSIRLPRVVLPLLITADPDMAFKLSFYPSQGIGLLRMEFMIMHEIGVHPMALARFPELKDKNVANRIEKITKEYASKPDYFINRLAEGIATTAAAFYPRQVILRMSDFKTNEYANLVGGEQFEPKEENPMLGFRGASRYYSPLYKDGFRLECEAVKKVRYEMGLDNIKVMIPFCRTPEEGRKVLNVMKEFGLDRDEDPGLEVYVMAEIPTNILQAEEFAEIFDGFSIGSNDLTQLTMGIDRDSSLVAELFTENNDAVKQLISNLIKKAKEAGAKVGLCGQAASDLPEFTHFLVESGIDSISFNPDALISGVENMSIAEEDVGVSVISSI